MEKSTFIVIPAYNEEKNILNTIYNTKKYAKKMIVIDDGSKDKTRELLLTVKDITVLHHLVNLGKGAALKTGCDYALLQKADNIIVLDADGQHNPEKIHVIEEQLNTHDIVFGYRQRSKTMPFVLRFGNWSLNKLTKLIFKIDLKDTQSGYRGFTAEAYKKIRWETNDYRMESEMIANTGKCKLKYAQIEIETIYQDKYKGTTVLDGLKIGLNIIFWGLKR